jgi:C-terminal processing protease CtpA/Prc
MGSIGGQVMSTFDIILDLDNDRMFIEPNATFDDPFACTFYGGVSILAEGKGFSVFRINDVLESSPASEVDLRTDDIIAAMDGTPAAELTLTQLQDMLKKSVACKVRIYRGEATMEVTLTPRPLV